MSAKAPPTLHAVPGRATVSATLPLGVDQLPEGERVSLALEAACEVGELATILVDLCRDLEARRFAVRGIAMRLRELAHVGMASLSDELEDPMDLRARLSVARVNVANGGAA